MPAVASLSPPDSCSATPESFSPDELEVGEKEDAESGIPSCLRGASACSPCGLSFSIALALRSVADEEEVLDAAIASVV